MDFQDSPEEATYRRQARAWLQSNARGKARIPHGYEDAASIEADKAWQATKAAAGYACITWPREWGGVGGTPTESIIFSEEERRLGLETATFAIGLGMCVPTIMTAGNDADKTRFVAPAMRGEEIWCQLFSEPAAGSDVAAGRTSAVPMNDGSGDWIVNGQKVWTSGAHYSDFGLLLVRTDPEVPKHKGLTMFWVDMKAPGVEVRPIHQADGGNGFNEVYFGDVRIKDAQRVGDVGKGWNVALVTLMNERLSVGGGAGQSWRALMELADGLPGVEGRGGSALQDGGFREKLADWYVAAEGLKLTRLRSQTALSRGQTPGPEASIGKIVSARQTQQLATEALDRLDQYGIVADGSASLAAGFQHDFFWGAAMRIAGGTDEILKNIIAERVLGLPLDIRVDRDVAFRNIPGAA